MFHALLSNFNVEEGDRKFLNSKTLRHYVIMGMWLNREWLFERLWKPIALTYGDPAGNRFSYLAYLRYMARRNTWGDLVVLQAFSYLTGIRLTILDAKLLLEHKIRHSKQMGVVRVVVVYNNRNHYIGTGECSNFLKHTL